ncbi:hypothetical protein BDK92_6964 [Micromonospora pisi]|uniref:Uncharacterized protein n=1 Tax=Micromonospora pisi TaxID=589240 RepID=A0A495JU57_9ACTN|nr:hypothetical protein BDK92_6964 [Micromonospora pisi]
MKSASTTSGPITDHRPPRRRDGGDPEQPESPPEGDLAEVVRVADVPPEATVGDPPPVARFGGEAAQLSVGERLQHYRGGGEYGGEHVEPTERAVPGDRRPAGEQAGEDHERRYELHPGEVDQPPGQSAGGPLAHHHVAPVLVPQAGPADHPVAGQPHRPRRDQGQHQPLPRGHPLFGDEQPTGDQQRRRDAPVRVVEAGVAYQNGAGEDHRRADQVGAECGGQRLLVRGEEPPGQGTGGGGHQVHPGHQAEGDRTRGVGQTPADPVRRHVAP